METSFKIKDARKAKKDIPKAIEIYLRTVDAGSDTETNEIYNYITNNFAETRMMFFYVLYHNGEVEGYAEYAYLPRNCTLVIDYICTKSRNHTYFYNYYHLILEDIGEILNKQSKHIKYIITELSLRKEGAVLTDNDSNYFRKLLSIEEYTLLKLPYYQPNLSNTYIDDLMEFNIAIKAINSTSNIIINKVFYLDLIDELYKEHYAQWYYHNHDRALVDKYIEKLLTIIHNSLPNKEEFQRINVVNCELFEEGLCKQISPDNITISKIRKQKHAIILKMVYWLVFSILTLVFCLLQFHPNFSTYIINIIAVLSSFITILTGLIAIIQYFKP